MKKLLTALLVTTWLGINAQKPDSLQAKQDSIVKAQSDSITKLVNEKFLVDKKLLDLTWKNIEDQVSVTFYRENINSFQIFQDALIKTWLEAYRKEQDAKKVKPNK